MGIKISNLKMLGRVKYFVVALALVLTSAPFSPLIVAGSASAAGTCAESRNELNTLIADSTVDTVSLCATIGGGNTADLSVTRDLTLDLGGYTLGGTIHARNGATLTIKNGTASGNVTAGSRNGDATGHIVIEGGTYSGSITARANSSVEISGGTFTGRLSANGSGTITITGGSFSSNPANYVAEGYTSIYNNQTRRYTVVKKAVITTEDVTIPVGGTADLFTINPAESYTYSVTEDGVPVQGVVVIEDSTEEGVLTGKVTGVTAGEYVVTITAETGASDTANIAVFDYEEVEDLVMFVDDIKTISIDTEGTEVDYSLSLATRGNPVSIDGKTITAVESGVAEINVTFNDSLQTTTSFIVNVYDFDEEDETLLIKTGNSSAFRVEGTRSAALSQEYDEEVVSVSENDGEFTVTGVGTGSTNLHFSLQTEDGETLEKTVTIYVYDFNEADLWVAKGASVAVSAELPEGVSISAESDSPYVAEFIGTDYLNISGLSAGDATITYTLSIDGASVEFGVNVHVYEFSVEDEIYLLAGTGNISVTDPAIATVVNGDAIQVRMSRGGDGATSLEGTTVADGVISAGNEAGDDELVFYIDTVEIGRIPVHVFTVDELDDQLLSVIGRGANRRTEVSVQGENLPSYTIASNDESVVSVDNGYINAENAGDATISVTFDAYGEPEVTFGVKVSNFHSDIARTYNAAEGGQPIGFTVSEEYNQEMISCTVDDVNCNESNVFDVDIDEDGVVTITVKEGARGGDYHMTFTDEMLPRNNTVSTTITVREIVIDETEYYLEVNESKTININTRGGSWVDSISARVVAADGGAINNASATCLFGYCTLRASKAGQYVVEVRDTNFWGTEVYATKYITLYVIDFTAEDVEYHVVKGDTGMHLVEALNEYWEKTYAEGVAGVAVWQKPGSSSEYAFVLDEDTEAGDYDLKFYAYAGPEMDVVRSTKTVTVHVYEMIAQNETVDGYAEADYYGEWFGTFNVNVHDKNALGRVTHTTEGRTGGLLIIGNNVVNTLPGKYTVTYTDRMNDGRGDEVGTYVANFEFYNLATYAQDETIIEPGETFEYNIIDALTYGEIYTTVTRDGEVIAEGEGTDPLDIDTSVEGKYEITIVNKSAEEHGFDETDTYYFYVVASETQTIFVKQGDSTIISSTSTWNVDNVKDETTGEEYTAEGNEVELDTTEMNLGTHELSLTHEFETGETATLKTVNVIVYKVTPDETTDPEAITEETIEDFFDMLNEAIANEDWDAFMRKAQAIFGDDVEGFEAYISTLMNARFGSEMNTEVVVTDINGSVSEEDVAAIDAVLEGIDYDHIDYYDISVIISSYGDPFGKLHQLDGAITVAVARAEDPAEGYVRQYFVIAKHGDMEEAIMLVEGTDFYISDGQIYIISDKFSTFAVAYKDTLKPKAPDTGNFTAMVGESVDTVSVNTVAIAAVMIAAAIALAGAVRFAKER